MTGEVICSMLGIRTNELHERVKNERRAGAPICATNKGYYIAESKEDMREYCESLYHRAGEIFKTRRACLKTMQNLPSERRADH
jgi:hypothetical protein